MARNRGRNIETFNLSENECPASSLPPSPEQSASSASSSAATHVSPISSASTLSIGFSTAIQQITALAVSPVLPTSISMFSHPISSQATLSRAVSAISRVPTLITSPGDHLSRAPSSTTSAPKERAATMREGVKTALVLLKESSDWLPQFKAVTGGLVSLINAIELTSANMADLDALKQNIDSLSSTIEENSQDGTSPWLRCRLSEFAEKLDEIMKNIKVKSSHGRFRRFAEGRKDKEDITAITATISHLVTKLQCESTLYNSQGIDKLLSDEYLKKLKESEIARYDAFLSAQSVQRRGCTPKTRKKILEDLMEWAKDPRSSKMYWMNGMAGTGKTTIAYSFCEQLQEMRLLGANFFCSRSLAECSDIRYIIPTIVSQLVRSCPQLASPLLEVLRGDFHIPPLELQFKRLLSEPFQRVSERLTHTPIVVIDALDECSNEASEIQLFLEHLCHYLGTIGRTNTIPLKVFITSRPEVVIHQSITPSQPTSPSEWSVIHIHDIEKSVVQEDIRVYIEDELAKITKTCRLEDGWPPSAEVDVLVGNANSLFIYAATVIRYVKEDSGDPSMRLSELASTSRVEEETSGESSSVTTELIDGLYGTILKRAFCRTNQVENQLIRTVLKLIVCAQTPLTFSGIVDFLNASGEFKIRLSTSHVRTSLKLLPSVISTPSGGDGVVTTFHASFPDFLFDSRRCASIFHLPFRQSHRDLACMCIRFMNQSLTMDNISGSDRWESVDTIKEKRIEGWISNALAYACMFWASHIGANDIEGLSTQLDQFLSHHVLRWLEVLGWLRRLDLGVEALQRMKEFKHPSLSSKFDDAHKFLKDIFDIINVWPCEVYHSGPVWAPEQSFLWNMYVKTPCARIVYGRRAGWGTCDHTIRGHLASVISVSVFPDGRHVVSGSSDKTVRIWNASTGEEEQVLRGHSSGVDSVAVSSDSRYIVSGSRDNTVRIWNASTGEEEHVLQGNSGWGISVAVSPDNCHIVSGSHDNTVRVWNISTGKQECVLRGHCDWVKSVAFFDNQHLISGSLDTTVRIWNKSRGREMHVLRGHSDCVNSVASLPHNRRIVSGSDDRTIRIWNALTGEVVHILQRHVGGVTSVAVSPDEHHIISGSKDCTIQIWNASTGEKEHTLYDHSHYVNSVSISPVNHHIVSGSKDNTIRIWNPSTGDEEYVPGGQWGWVTSVTASPGNHRMISGSMDRTVRVWNVLTGEEELILEGHSRGVNSVAVSSDGRHIVSASQDTTVRIWNASTGEEEHVLRHDDAVTSVTVSSDNRIVSGSHDHTVRIWNVWTGEEEHVLVGHRYTVESVAVSPDGCHIVSGSGDKTVRIWNALSGEAEHVLRGHSGPVTSIAVSPDNRRVVSASNDMTVRIWNISMGKEDSPSVIPFTDSNVTSGQPDAVPLLGFISSITALVALLVQGDDIISIPAIERSVCGESLSLEVLLQAVRNELSVVPIALAADQSSILLSDGKKCLAIPSALRDISSAAFSGSNVYFGHKSGQITILDISV